jgi:periplasmic protein CpxP/Spy
MLTARTFSPFALSAPARMWLATAALALAAGFSQTAMAQAPEMAADLHGGMDHGGRGMGDPMRHGGGRHMDRMLDVVNATPEQRAQIKQIMQTARTDMQAQREGGRGLREQQMALLAAPTIDARAVETLRQQMLARHDTASKRMSQAMIDAANVLTPPQRKQLADMMAKRMSMMKRHAAERDAVGMSGQAGK